MRPSLDQDPADGVLPSIDPSVFDHKLIFEPLSPDLISPSLQQIELPDLKKKKKRRKKKKCYKAQDGSEKPVESVQSA